MFFALVAIMTIHITTSLPLTLQNNVQIEASILLLLLKELGFELKSSAIKAINELLA